MESLKKPEMILSIVNTLWLASITVYGQKKISELKSDIDSLKVSVNGILQSIANTNSYGTRIAEIVETIKQKDQLNSGRDTKLVTLNKNYDDLSYQINTIYSLLESLTKQIKNGGMDIKLRFEEEEEEVIPRRFTQRRPQRGRGFREQKGETEVEEEEEEEFKSQVSNFRGGRGRQ